MKAYSGIGSTAPLILNLCSRQSVYHREITCSSYQTGGGVGPRARLGAFITDVSFAAGRELGCPTCSLVTTLNLLPWLLIDLFKRDKLNHCIQKLRFVLVNGLMGL